MERFLHQKVQPKREDFSLQQRWSLEALENFSGPVFHNFVHCRRLTFDAFEGSETDRNIQYSI